jgi:hypothetical protein
MAYVQLSPDTLTVTCWFAGPQPGNTAVAQVADDDPRLVAFLTPSPPTTIPADVFLARFTPIEQIAVQTAAAANPQIAFGLTLGLAQGFVILNSPVLSNWMAGLVAVGALTPARATQIMTP